MIILWYLRCVACCLRLLLLTTPLHPLLPEFERQLFPGFPFTLCSLSVSFLNATGPQDSASLYITLTRSYLPFATITHVWNNPKSIYLSFFKLRNSFIQFLVQYHHLGLRRFLLPNILQTKTVIFPPELVLPPVLLTPVSGITSHLVIHARCSMVLLDSFLSSTLTVSLDPANSTTFTCVQYFPSFLWLSPLGLLPLLPEQQSSRWLPHLQFCPPHIYSSQLPKWAL